MNNDTLPAVQEAARREIAEGAVAKARDAYERYAHAGEQALNAIEVSMAQAFEGWRQVTGATREAATQLMDSNVTGARKAREQWEAAGARLYNAFEDNASQMLSAMREIGHRMLVASDTNVRASLDFAEKLAAASDPREMLQLQVTFLQDQSQRITDQVVDLHKTTTRLAREAATRAESQ
ncbi:phasin family protein [Methylobacterium sp. J-076]|uniref:phasin family protein n=1 Tax=Methylobacterium sp. J-076 TaxID=2836655 RepID=UPI001FBA828D|nr:phasin family protein [Methylobacterium sp. J-076]MCJ2013788.1 phasin family protein [Methylobacterium sp. J-076]